MSAQTVSSTGGVAERLLALAMTAKVADLLDALTEAGVFTRLADGPVACRDLAAALGLHEDFLDVALRLAVRFDYLTCQSDNRYALSEGAQAVTAVLDLERATARWHRDNDSLLKVLRSGDRQDPLDVPDADRLRPVYDRALGGVVRTLALNVARHVPRVERPSVVDLGGGDGSLAVALHEHIPVRALVVDRAATQPAFDRRVPMELRDAVRFQPLDLREPEALEVLERVSAVDLVILSNVVHLLNPVERAALWRTLATGGPARVLVYDQFPQGAEDAGDPTAANGLPGLGDLMVIDWLRCGVRFDLTAAQLAEEAEGYGLCLERIAQPFGMPGRFVVLKSTKGNPIMAAVTDRREEGV